MYHKLRNFKGVIIILGHEQQNGYINNSGFKYVYSQCDFLGDLVNYNRTNKELVLGKCRFKTQETIDALNYFMEHGTMPRDFKFKNIDRKLETNICFYKNTRDAVNKLFSKKIKVGDRVRLTANYPKEEMYNGDEFRVENIINGLVNGVFSMKDIELAYCNTTHSFQGGTIAEQGNIYNFNCMTFENQYTALSRFTDIRNIHIDNYNCQRARSEYDEEFKPTPLKLLIAGHIYQMYDGEFWYAGMTKRPEKRENKHNR